MKPPVFVLFILTTSIFACTRVERTPNAADFEKDRATRIQEIDLMLAKFWNNDWKADQKAFQQSPISNAIKPVYDRSLLDNPNNQNAVERLAAERQVLVSELSSKLQPQSWTGTSPWFESTFYPLRANKIEQFQIKDPSAYTLAHPVLLPFPLEHRFYSSYKLRLENLLPYPSKVQAKSEDFAYYLKARMECDAEMIYSSSVLMFQKEKRSKVYEFNWYYTHKNTNVVQIEFSPNVTRCNLIYYDPEVAKTWTHGVTFADLLTTNPEWYKLSNQVEVCARPPGPMADSVTEFFWRQDFNFNTCTRSYDQLAPLVDTYDIINQRILALTGSPLSRKDFNNKYPLTTLNFSKAPKFDVIWVSSLNFSADFYGVVLSRALRYHAERGTQIRILTADATMKKKDKALIDGLQQGQPTIKVQYYRYNLSDSADGKWVDKFHRVSHTKLLIGYSASNPKVSFLVTGGRNIRDSYLFKEAPIYKAYEALKNYGGGEEPFIFYQDFEVLVRGQEFVKSVLSQMISFWMRDPETQSFRSTNINIPKAFDAQEAERLTSLSKNTPLIRHLLSLPYFDGYQLEKFYVQMIDSARSEIMITTPYFRPSVAIAAAFDRAAGRGVKIQILTRIHLAGDDVPQIAEDVNKQGINRLLNNVEIFEWTDSKSIIHAKMVVVDKRMGFVSSVNLNRRSFLHDVESGVLILHDKTAKDLRAQIQAYIGHGRRITQKERISWLNSTLIDWADNYF